jgi:PleD family two-component response regulator
MENENKHDFDLTTLLKLDGLDIRKVAKNDPSFTVGEYYSFLEILISQREIFQDTLSRIADLSRISDLETNENDSQNMALLKKLLEGIGHDSFVSIVDDIINLLKRGHYKSALDRIQKLPGDFSVFNDQIMAARKPKPGETQFSKETQLLSKVINLLDHEEATRKLGVLAVDDAPSMIKTISAILEINYQVYGISNPTMVEKFLHQITPELFLLDYEMPDLNGFDLVPIIRSFKEHKDTPIIFLTSMGTIDHVSAAYVLGARDFIVKPFQDSILREKVAKHIVRKKLF